MPDLPSRKRLRKLDRLSDDRGEFAELLVSEIYNLKHTGGDVEWYDAVHRETGTKYEVKSTEKELADGATGRFRLWSDQHRSLLSADAVGTAWYVFVLFDSSGGLEDWRRMHPATVSGLVEDFNIAKHSTKEGRQHKLPWTQVFDE